MSFGVFEAEDGGTVFLLNVGTHPQVHTASQSRRPSAMYVWLSKLKGRYAQLLCCLFQKGIKIFRLD
jgi:hypothetical protein